MLEQDERSPERVVRYRTQKMKMPNGMVYPSFRPGEVFALFERETFDCIHVHHPIFAGIWALSLGKKYDIPVIYTYHTRYAGLPSLYPVLPGERGTAAYQEQIYRLGKRIRDPVLYEMVLQPVRSGGHARPPECCR